MSDFYGPLTGWGWLICTPIAIAAACYVGMVIVQGAFLLREVRGDKKTR